MQIERIEVTPFGGQSPGTSGLRKKTRVMMEPHYLAAFVQSIWSAIDGVSGKTLILGGDGRYFNAEAIQLILRMAAASGAARVVVGQGGILSTPAASHLIRKRGADGGIILSASHNPGGIDEDFGIKFNGANGGPATAAVTDRMVVASQAIDHYLMLDTPDYSIDLVGQGKIGEMSVEIVDPVADYAEMLEELFDFDKIRGLFAGGFRMAFDAMHAVTGPYATEVIERRLGAAPGTVMNGTPQVDFGGRHPDPNPIWAHALMDVMYQENGPDFGAVSDGDGDRNMIVGPSQYVSPSDSLAILAANAHLAKGYRAGLAGVARSMPTSRAVDRVAAAMDMPCYETPTGWKFFGTLLDDGRVTLCGEESAGTGSDHVREKDGLWAVMLWLNILAETCKGVGDIMSSHWATFGRNYYTRHDYEAVEVDRANAVMDGLRAQLGMLAGQTFAGRTIDAADEFSYVDPVDGSTASAQGLRLSFEGGGRIVFRLSGTGTQGATLRVYIEDFINDKNALDGDVQVMLEPMIALADRLARITELTGRDGPDIRS